MDAAIRRAIYIFALGILAGFAVCSSGCATIGVRGSEYPGADLVQAEWVAWHDVYQRSDKPPKVLVVTEFSCIDKTSGDPGFKTIVGCRNGFTITPWDVSVGKDSNHTWSQVPLCHENMHALQARSAVFDPEHKTTQFQKLESCGDCAYKPPEPRRICKDDALLGMDCVTVQANPCGQCGLVQWCDEQLARQGL